ncbi:hypothetical protein DCAR_0625598 [Daucus carota subsp. sativus]|uniref:Uncharacterized protein n=1 Tax=Daucus carota subsp. sativus TaxID=79200 RepID=A0A164WK40_DAUCS|nr:hypothetical protein DCAR_0625598 [Daucus carota subsp. sativus]
MALVIILVASSMCKDCRGKGGQERPKKLKDQSITDIPEVFSHEAVFTGMRWLAVAI